MGFAAAGFEVVLSVDNDDIHADAHEANFSGTGLTVADLADLDGSELMQLTDAESVDVVFGGPPCQGFSLGGRRQPNDPRNELLFAFARRVVEIQPRYFVMENVPGLSSPAGWPALREFVGIVRRGNFEIVDPIQILNAQDFGVPQNRKRLIVLGYRRGERPPEYPRTVTGLLVARPTVADAISDLIHVSGKYPQEFSTLTQYAKQLETLFTAPTERRQDSCQVARTPPTATRRSPGSSKRRLVGSSP